MGKSRLITVEKHEPEPVVQPPPTYVIRSHEGHGTWRLIEAEARELYEQLRDEFGEDAPGFVTGARYASAIGVTYVRLDGGWLNPLGDFIADGWDVPTMPMTRVS